MMDYKYKKVTNYSLSSSLRINQEGTDLNPRLDERQGVMAVETAVF